MTTTDESNLTSDDQLRWLAEAHDPMTIARLATTGVSDGWYCLEVGTGNGSVARWLADRAAPSGRVFATDVAPRPLPEHPCLTTVEHDVVTEPLPAAAFDLITARLVLQVLPDRLAVLDKLVRALKPGGWLQVDEYDASYEPLLLAPSAHARELYESFLAAKAAAMRAAGGDPSFGRHAASAMRAAGLVDVEPRPYVQPRRPGSPELALQLSHTYRLRGQLLAAGMTERRLAEVREVMADPLFHATSGVMYSVQGRRPGKEVPA